MRFHEQVIQTDKTGWSINLRFEVDLNGKEISSFIGFVGCIACPFHSGIRSLVTGKIQNNTQQTRSFVSFSIQDAYYSHR